MSTPIRYRAQAIRCPFTDYHFSVVPTVDGKAELHSPHGTGCYLLSEFNPGVRTALEKNPNAWQGGECYWGPRPVEDLILSIAYLSDSPWNDTLINIPCGNSDGRARRSRGSAAPAGTGFGGISRASPGNDAIECVSGRPEYRR